MSKLYSVQIPTIDETKEIAVFCEDVTTFDQPIDILITSAFGRCYAPTPRTVFHALYRVGIDVEKLAYSPAFDLRETCQIWLSNPTQSRRAHINRIGCIELSGARISRSDNSATEDSILKSLRAYFCMLDIAAIY